jgi:hypothetical protein
MNTSALITMILAQGIVTVFTIYFFIKVWKNPRKDEGDFPPGP